MSDFSSLTLLSLTCIRSSAPWNPTMQYLREATPFLSFWENNIDIFFVWSDPKKFIYLMAYQFRA